MMISCSKALGAVSRMLCTVLKSKGQASSWKQRMTLAVGRPLAGCCCRHLQGKRVREPPRRRFCRKVRPGPSLLHPGWHTTTTSLLQFSGSPGISSSSQPHRDPNTLQQHLLTLYLRSQSSALLNPAHSLFLRGVGPINWGDGPQLYSGDKQQRHLLR